MAVDYSLHAILCKDVSRRAAGAQAARTVSDRPRPVQGASRRALLSGCVAIAAVGWSFANVGAVADSVARAYGIGLAGVGLMTTALVATHAMLNIPGGKGADRAGARRMVLVGLGLIAAASALASVVSVPALAMGARVLTGVGTAFAFVASSDYVRAMTGGSSLGQGLVGGAAVGGSGLALALVPQVEAWLDWRAPFLTALAVSVLALAVFSLSPALAGKIEPRRRENATRTLELLRDVRLYRLAAMHMASMGLTLVVANWVVTLLARYGGYSHSLAGAIGALTLLMGVVGRPAGGLLARKGPALMRLMMALSLLAGAAGTGVLATAPAPALAAPAAVVVGLASGIPFAPVMHAAAMMRPDAPGAAVGQTNMFGNLVLLGGTPLLGLSFSLPGGGRLGFALVAGLWALALTALPSQRELRGEGGERRARTAVAS